MTAPSDHSIIALRNCADRVEAETIRIRLAAADIPAFITGTDTATALSMGGAGSNRLVRVEVASRDYQRAAQLLRDDELRAQQAGAWVCGRCSEINEASFDVCWSCNKSRSEQDLPAPSEHPTDAAEGDPFGDLSDLATPLAPTEDGNPYRPVLVDEAPQPRRWGPPETLSAVTEDSISRALRAAAIGMLLLPPLLNFYSLYLLSTIPAAAYHQQRYRWRLWIAWGINVVVVPASILFWLPQFG